MNNYTVTRSSMPSFEEYIEEIKPLWETRWLTNRGIKHEHFREALLEYLKVDNVQLFCNGHQALESALLSLNLPEGSEVITTPFTFASTTFSIIRAGLTPVFCDIDPMDFTIDAKLIESLITEKTKAIVPVHVYGNICNIEEIEQIAKKHDLKVVYDAAHAFGESYKGAGIGSFGDASMFSFHATKVFHTIEGGAVCYKDDLFGKNLRNIQNFGIEAEDVITCVGGNAKMNEFQAAMGICNLRHLDDSIRKRKRASELYRSKLSEVKGIRLNSLNSFVKSNYAYFPIVIAEEETGISRDLMKERLHEQHINTRKYFFPAINSLPFIDKHCSRGNTPVAEAISNAVLTLPLYEDLTEEDVCFICDNIIRIIENGK